MGENLIFNFINKKIKNSLILCYEITCMVLNTPKYMTLIILTEEYFYKSSRKNQI